MPVVCDFIEIVGDRPVTIGDKNPGWEKSFNTAGRNRSHSGFLIFNVRHLTHTDRDVPVRINGTRVGFIYNYRPGGGGIDRSNGSQPEKFRQADHWYTQMIAFSGRQIDSGDNTISIEAVSFPEDTSSNRFDDFQIKNLVCFFHQSA